MERYPYYKIIDLPWLKEIPAHWTIKKNKNVLHERKELVAERSSEYTLLSLTLNGIIPRDVTSGKGKFPKSFDTYKIVNEGDMGFCLFDMDETPRTVGLSRTTGMLTGAYDIFSVTDVNPNYINYYYTALDDVKALRFYYTGLRKTINVNTFMNLKLPIPPIEEQEQIVRFFEWKTSLATKLSHAKRREVELLRELRDTIFAELISKSNETVKLKHLVELIYDPVEIDPDLMYRKAGMYNRGRGIFVRDEISGDSMGDSKFQYIHQNCIMLSGQFAWEGAVYVTTHRDEIAVASHRYYLLKPTQDKITPEYIYAYLASEKGVLDMNKCSHGAAGRNKPLNIKELLNIEIPLPTEYEEVEKINVAVRNLMQFQLHITEKTKLIEEIRAKMVFDIVTGKIDVSKTPIPEFSEETDMDVLDSDEEFDDEEV